MYSLKSSKLRQKLSKKQGLKVLFLSPVLISNTSTIWVQNNQIFTIFGLIFGIKIAAQFTLNDFIVSLRNRQNIFIRTRFTRLCLHLTNKSWKYLKTLHNHHEFEQRHLQQKSDTFPKRSSQSNRFSRKNPLLFYLKRLEPKANCKIEPHVDKAVEKLWINCGRSCGKLSYPGHLWKAVDKAATYPQQKPTYPHFYPQSVYCPGQEKHPISTVSTGPTIDRRFSLNLFRFASLVE